jgi:MFS family permease
MWPKEDSWAISMLSAGHFLSHYYFLALPPVFPLLKAEFGVSYTELGLAMTSYNLLGGLAQAPVGFLVDRLGPRRVLIVGLGLNAAAITLMGFVDAYWMLLALAVVAGLGNSVFHPSDYAIMSGSIGESRLGRAFSIHTFSGFLGGACAPLGMLAIAGIAGWRAALITAGLAGLVVMAVMMVKGGVMVGETRRARPMGIGGRSGLHLLFTAPVLLFLCFFIAYGMAAGGLAAFTVSGLINLHGIGLDWANTALTGHLFGVVAGIAIAGVIADRFRRHGITAAGALILACVFVLVPVAFTLPEVALVVVMIVVGLGLGAVLPPRDLMVRAMTPPGETGKVFGFVFVGYAIGASLTPLLFGWFLDTGQPAMVFVLTAVFVAVALTAITLARRLSLGMATQRVAEPT